MGQVHYGGVDDGSAKEYIYAYISVTTVSLLFTV